jgi:hypothetical protein
MTINQLLLLFLVIIGIFCQTKSLTNKITDTITDTISNTISDTV